MPETYNDDLWRDSEQDDSSSSTDSYLYLESSNDTEIVTVPAEHVPRVYTEVDQTFPQERFMRAFVLSTADINRETQDGGAPGSDAVQYADDTVLIQDKAQTQDTTQIQDTDADHTSQTLQTWDSDVYMLRTLRTNRTHRDKHIHYSYISYLFAIILLIFIYHVFNFNFK